MYIASALSIFYNVFYIHKAHITGKDQKYNRAAENNLNRLSPTRKDLAKEYP